jgi:predicted MFS family arabinose efflux permease
MGPPLIGYISAAAGLRYSFAVIGIFGICITLMVYKIKVMN